jgi:hypothetical protein
MSFEAATRIVPALPTAWALTVAPEAPADVAVVVVATVVVVAAVVVAWLVVVVVVTVGAVVAPVPPQAANMTASAVNAMRAVIRRVIRGTPCDRSSGRDHTALYDGRWRSVFTAHGMHRLRIVDGGEVD